MSDLHFRSVTILVNKFIIISPVGCAGYLALFLRFVDVELPTILLMLDAVAGAARWAGGTIHVLPLPYGETEHHNVKHK